MSSQLLQRRKIQPVQKCSAFNLLIDYFAEVKLWETILSKRLQFLDSDTVWWTSIKKVSGNFGVRVELQFYLEASDSLLKSGVWSCNVSGTINGKQFKTSVQRIRTKETCCSTCFDPEKSIPLELKLEMKISLSDDLDKIPLQKFIDSTPQYRNIISNNESILNSSKHSDFTFIVSGRIFKVHKVILAAASPIFDKLFETKFSETLTNQCNVTEIEPMTFQYLLDYIYCGKLPEEIHDEKVSRSLFKAAHYYQITGLADICTSVLHYNLTEENAADVYEFAYTYGLEDVKTDAWKIIRFDILELFEAEQPPPIESMRSLIAIKDEKKKLLEEYQRKLSQLDFSTRDLLK